MEIFKSQYFTNKLKKKKMVQTKHKPCPTKLHLSRIIPFLIFFLIF